jgi:hypothetical protein
VPVKKFDTDYQIAYGDPFSVTVNEKYMPARLWVFGRIDAFYNRSYPTSKILVTSEDMQKLETGTYTILVQNPGKNAIFEAGYAKTVTDVKTTEELVSPWAAVDPINIYGSQPRLVLTEFRKMITGTDDPLTEYRLEVAHPVIDMVSVDETYSEGKDVLDIRGYTNVAKGTEITFVMDKERQIPQTLRANTHMELVREEAPNQWRYFQIFIPIDYNNTIVGQHQITASTPQGATQTIPFYVYDLPEGQEIPNQTIKYVSGNQFIPPVIVTVTIPIPGPTQIVTVKVTPPNEQVYAQQKLAEDKKWEEKKAEYISWAMTACGGLFLIGITWYGSSVVKRARRKE